MYLHKLVLVKFILFNMRHLNKATHRSDTDKLRTTLAVL